MEKTWYQKLMSVYTEHTDAEFEEKSENKITRALQDWENISRDALLVTEMLEFKEILSWRDCIAPKFQDSYANILKKRALTSPDRLLAVILTGKTDEVMAISEKFDISLLSETTGKVILKGMGDDKVRANVLTVVNNRPDILTQLSSETFKYFSINEDNTTFLKNKKLNLLLNCFHNSGDFEKFSNRIKLNKRFLWLFNHHEKILQDWDELSDVELQDFPDFKRAITAYNNASEGWQMNLENFKKILKLIDHEHFSLFLGFVKDDFGPESFYVDALMIAKNNLTMKQLKSGELDYKTIYDQSFVADHDIPKIRRKIIQKYLES